MKKNVDGLSAEQKAALDDMVRRRMANTGETKEQASDHIAAYLKLRAEELR